MTNTERKPGFTALLVALAALSVLLFGSVREARADSLFSAQGKGLYTDKTVRQIGDLITIIIMESSTATNSTQTSNAKNASASANLAGVGPAGVKAQVGVGDAWKDTETTSRKGALVARMTARVMEVLPNGDLVVTGNRVIVVNNERQTLTVKGIVRQQDIAPDNTVSSGLVGNAEIRFDGSPDWQNKGNIFGNLWEGLKTFFVWLF